ncbi:hypothetical protein PMIT1342_00070 [Prochlorococcus marinus str. MIT 1342]|nr:hypothetical protein PMIT1342_00070 [Prochlorococcus marinus str. MIT 1342]
MITRLFALYSLRSELGMRLIGLKYYVDKFYFQVVSLDC